jgi:hypothetical protein
LWYNIIIMIIVISVKYLDPRVMNALCSKPPPLSEQLMVAAIL